MPKPVMKSITEFVDYLSLHLGMVRNMRKLSRDDPFLVAWDQVMGERWTSVVNGNSPTPEQRRAALEERHNVAETWPRLLPAMRQLLVSCHSLHSYVISLPPPPQTGGGWHLKADMVHADAIIKMLSAAIADTRCAHALDGENAFFKELFDQLLEMARWTRTSLNPDAADRAKVNLGRYAQEELDEQLKAVVTSVCRSMHDFCELYADFPALPPKTRIQLDPLTGPKG
jgi:hypothetical protein